MSTTTVVALTDPERDLLAQALADYREGIEDALRGDDPAYADSLLATADIIETKIGATT